MARGTQNGHKIGTKRNRNRDSSVVFSCRSAACHTLCSFFSTRNACWRGGLRGGGVVGCDDFERFPPLNIAAGYLHNSFDFSFVLSSRWMSVTHDRFVSQMVDVPPGSGGKGLLGMFTGGAETTESMRVGRRGARSATSLNGRIIPKSQLQLFHSCPKLSLPHHRSSAELLVFTFPRGHRGPPYVLVLPPRYPSSCYVAVLASLSPLPF
jgi:hypothetical protein